ncbi:dephospho-CoA kinase [Terracidiphilus sp.]|jgi:dephospho-CoA kinase|uniref:dephospho-CoA kinase n=1 Tax=Terracidiphilus sp. TaxID=1964191 RepID=UPI003C29397B
MLRVGLTGGLGSGKSTIAAMLLKLGAHVIEADEMGRVLMEPGQAVYNEIVRVFGLQVVAADSGKLNRAKLAELAFHGGRIHELNTIVHPAVIAAQREWMQRVFANDPHAVAVVESALIFEVERDARARGESESVLSDWRNRFDRVIVVTAPDAVRIDRYVERVCIGKEDVCRERAVTDARERMSRQIPDAEKAARADFVIENAGDKAALEMRVAEVWELLKAESRLAGE